MKTKKFTQRISPQRLKEFRKELMSAICSFTGTPEEDGHETHAPSLVKDIEKIVNKFVTPDTEQRSIQRQYLSKIIEVKKVAEKDPLKWRAALNAIEALCEEGLKR